MPATARVDRIGLVIYDDLKMKLKLAVLLTLAAVLLFSQATPPTPGPISGVTGLAYDAQVKATVTGAVTSTLLATCPAGASKFCIYQITRNIQCTSGSSATGVGTVGVALTWTDGFGNFINSAASPTINVATCNTAAGGAVITAIAGPGTTLVYAVTGGTGTYSVDYGIIVLRIL